MNRSGYLTTAVLALMRTRIASTTWKRFSKYYYQVKEIVLNVLVNTTWCYQFVYVITEPKYY